MTTFDFNSLIAQAKSASFDALPKGDYDAECISAEAVKASTGKPMLKCKFRVLTGPHAKRQFFNQFVLVVDNPQALAMFFRNMKAFGLDEGYFGQIGAQGLVPVAQALLGRQARFSLDIRPYMGEDRNEVKAVKPLQGGVVQAAGGLPGGGLPGVPAGLPTAAAAPVTPPAQPVTPPPASVAPAAEPVAPQQVVQQPLPPQPAPVVQQPAPVPPQQPAPVTQPVEAPAPATPAPATPYEQPTPPAQPEPQPTPPVEQAAPVAAAPAVSPPPPMPF